MIIVRLLSPGPWLVGTTKVYPGVGADIVMESISLFDHWSTSDNAMLRQLSGQAEVSPLSCKTGRSLGCGWHLGDLGILEGDDLPLVLVLYHDQRGSGFYFARLVAFLELDVRSGE